MRRAWMPSLWHIITWNYFDFQFGIRKMFFLEISRQIDTKTILSCLQLILKKLLNFQRRSSLNFRSFQSFNLKSFSIIVGNFTSRHIIELFLLFIPRDERNTKLIQFSLVFGRESERKSLFSNARTFLSVAQPSAVTFTTNSNRFRSIRALLTQPLHEISSFNRGELRFLFRSLESNFMEGLDDDWAARRRRESHQYLRAVSQNLIRINYNIF